MEKSKEELQFEIHKGNKVIKNLQQQVGGMSGTIAHLQMENENLLAYIQQNMEKEEEAEKEE